MGVSSYERKYSNDDIIINADGTITRKNVDSSNYNDGPSDGGGSNTGIIIACIIIVMIIVVGLIVVSNRDGGDSTYDEPISTVYEIDEEPVVADVGATYLNVSRSTVSFSANGGSVDIDVSTDGDWSIGTSTASWGHLSKYGSYVTLTVDPNTESESRTDWFTIEAGSYEKKIEITQAANTKPSAKIERVWVDHNIFNNGVKGMMIHIKCKVENLKGQMVDFYAYFYQGDNSTPLHDSYGNNLSFSARGEVLHKSGEWDDLRIFVPHTGLNMAPGVSGEFSFDVSVKHNGRELDRDNNNRFTFTSGY